MIANPYAAPAAGVSPYGAGGVRSYFAAMQGDVLVLSKHSPALPNVCMKCGTTHDIMRRNAKFQWTPVWARLMVVFCTLGGAIAMLVTRKSAELSVPLCAACNARWSKAVVAMIACVIALVVGLFSMGPLEEVGLALFASSLVALIGVSLGVAKPRTLQAHKIDDQNVELKGVHPEAARVIVGA